jgi:hypothetical protein
VGHPQPSQSSRRTGGRVWGSLLTAVGSRGKREAMLLIAAVCLNQTLSFFGGVGGHGNGGQDPEIGHLLTVQHNRVVVGQPSACRGSR